MKKNRIHILAAFAFFATAAHAQNPSTSNNKGVFWALPVGPGSCASTTQAWNCGNVKICDVTALSSTNYIYTGMPPIVTGDYAGDWCNTWQVNCTGTTANATSFDIFPSVSADGLVIAFGDLVPTPAGGQTYQITAYNSSGGIVPANSWSIQSWSNFPSVPCTNGVNFNYGSSGQILLLPVPGTAACVSGSAGYVLTVNDPSSAITRIRFEKTTSLGDAINLSFGFRADAGDAPDTYKTYWDNNASGSTTSSGPGHILHTNAAVTRFGSVVSADGNGKPGTGATNDNGDDGLTNIPPLAISTTSANPQTVSYSVTVNYVNNNTFVAPAAAWLDLNTNGVFDAGEVRTANAAASSTGTLTFNWTGVTLSGAGGTGGTYLRLRIGRTTQSQQPAGVDDFGEVEDYYVPFTTVLPLKLVSFSGKANNCNAAINWETTDEVNTAKFDIQSSTDGISFTTVQSQAAAGFAAAKTYNATVAQGASLVYYRLKITDRDGSLTYSQVITVRSACDGSKEYMSINPNPLVSNIANLSVGTKYTGKASIMMTNAMGQQLMNQSVTVKSGANVFPVNMDKMSPGTYMLYLVNVSGEKIGSSQKIVKQ